MEPGQTTLTARICSDGEELCKLIAKHGFQTGVIMMADRLKAKGNPPASSLEDTVRKIVREELAWIKAK